MFLGDTNTESQLVIPWCTYTDPEVAHVGQVTLLRNAALTSIFSP
jgi:pyruvate/2-oxoglutarate dehydrogenase complex dihydrolipoamide dehydrogenase (E3) component